MLTEGSGFVNNQRYFISNYHFCYERISRFISNVVNNVNTRIFEMKYDTLVHIIKFLNNNIIFKITE
jgi:hypothetical protein